MLVNWIRDASRDSDITRAASEIAAICRCASISSRTKKNFSNSQSKTSGSEKVDEASAVAAAQEDRDECARKLIRSFVENLHEDSKRLVVQRALRTVGVEEKFFPVLADAIGITDVNELLNELRAGGSSHANIAPFVPSCGSNEAPKTKRGGSKKINLYAGNQKIELEGSVDAAEARRRKLQLLLNSATNGDVEDDDQIAEGVAKGEGVDEIVAVCLQDATVAVELLHKSAGKLPRGVLISVWKELLQSVNFCQSLFSGLPTWSPELERKLEQDEQSNGSQVLWWKWLEGFPSYNLLFTVVVDQLGLARGKNVPAARKKQMRNLVFWMLTRLGMKRASTSFGVAVLSHFAYFIDVGSGATSISTSNSSTEEERALKIVSVSTMMSLMPDIIAVIQQSLQDQGDLLRNECHNAARAWARALANNIPEEVEDRLDIEDLRSVHAQSVLACIKKRAQNENWVPSIVGAFSEVDDNTKPEVLLCHIAETIILYSYGRNDCTPIQQCAAYLERIGKLLTNRSNDVWEEIQAQYDDEQQALAQFQKRSAESNNVMRNACGHIDLSDVGIMIESAAIVVNHMPFENSDPSGSVVVPGRRLDTSIPPLVESTKDRHLLTWLWMLMALAPKIAENPQYARVLATATSYVLHKYGGAKGSKGFNFVAHWFHSILSAVWPRKKKNVPAHFTPLKILLQRSFSFTAGDLAFL